MTFPFLDLSRLFVCPLYALEVPNNVVKVNVAICSHFFLDWLAYVDHDGEVTYEEFRRAAVRNEAIPSILNPQPPEWDDKYWLFFLDIMGDFIWYQSSYNSNESESRDLINCVIWTLTPTLVVPTQDRE